LPAVPPRPPGQGSRVFCQHHTSHAQTQSYCLTSRSSERLFVSRRLLRRLYPRSRRATHSRRSPSRVRRFLARALNRAILFAALSCVLLTEHAAAELPLTPSVCEFRGSRYEFSVTNERLSRCPQWDPTETENPPIAASAALKAARQFIATIPSPHNWPWRLAQFRLQHVSNGKWAWGVFFTQVPPGRSSGPRPHMEAWILMDGTAIEPVVTALPAK
jgi:hypothetical protein